MLIADHRNTQFKLEGVGDRRTDKAYSVGRGSKSLGAEVEQGEDHWTPFTSTAPDDIFHVSS